MRKGRLLHALLCLTLAVSLPGPPLPLRAGEAPGGEAAARFARALAAKLPRKRFDPAAFLASLGAGASPEALAKTVRERTRLVPYRGALRGAAGALAGGGNSLDRALLLAELLRGAGHPVRMANATLGGSRVFAMMAAASAASPEAGDALAPIRAAIAASGAETGFDAAPLAAAIDEIFASFDALRPETARQATADGAALKALARLPNDDGAAERASQEQALADHWWVEYRDAAGAWHPLDPSRAAGAAAETPSRLIDIDAAKPAEASLPEDLLHRLRIQVIVEEWRNDGRSEHTALDATVIPALAIDRSIAIRFLPVEAPPPADGDFRSFKQSLAAATLWRPYLTLGDTTIAGRKFNAKGLVKTGGETGPKGGGGLFGSKLDTIGEGIDELGDGILSAAWVDYTILAPGSPERTIRRQIFDLAGPAARAVVGAGQPILDGEKEAARALALGQGIDVLPQVAPLPAAFIAHRVASAFAAAAANAGEAPVGAGRLGGFAGLGDLPLLALAHLRDAWSPHRGAIDIAALNVLTAHAGPLAPADDDRALFAIDIVANDVVARPGIPVDPRTLRIEQGIVDTIAEAAVVDGSAVFANAARLFAASQGGAGWRAVIGADDLAGIAADADARTRLAAEIAAGALVVAPSGAAAGDDGFAWWRIDPVTGTTLGMNRVGWGADSTDYFILISSDAVEAGTAVAEASTQGSIAQNAPFVIPILFVTVCAWLQPLGKWSKTVANFAAEQELCLKR